MADKAKWIWYPGDFETYHHLILSCRRQEFGCDYPCMWRLSSPEKSACFIKDFIAENDTILRVVTHSKGMVLIAGRKRQVNCDIPVPAGKHRLEVQLYDIEAFPSLYVNNEYVVSDETWTVEARDTRWVNVCCEPEYLNESDDPRVFPFEYEKIVPVSVENINGGRLYDFGKETFGPVTLEDVDNPDGIELYYGESREEALDEEWAVIKETLTGRDPKVRPARAFRYILVKSPDGKEIDISAEYEYLPLKDIGSFECDVPEIRKIWDTCAYTFHLNSREFFLDGIKRDRWVWSGDAYQSFMINRCLFNDNGITERTIVALLGKPPYHTHINHINDYSCYLIISVYEHYLESGRTEFVKRIWENLNELFGFIVSRLDDDGLSVGRYGDWVFVDWGELDKEGPHFVEQVLLWKVYKVMTELSAVVGENSDYSEKAGKLAKLINEKYWNDEKGAYIDTFASGRNFVTRQSNVFAVLFDFADEKKTESIIENVFNNPDLPQITTPYFKLYELLALCRCGKIKQAQEYILSYWGGILNEGATSIWEAYDESRNGIDHYGMYGMPYGKSLCHAWGSGPILLLIRYCMGIRSTSVGGKTFMVEPDPGMFKNFRAVAPVGNGYVEVKYSDGSVYAESNVPGGTLIWNGEKLPVRVVEK